MAERDKDDKALLWMFKNEKSHDKQPDFTGPGRVDKDVLKELVEAYKKHGDGDSLKLRCAAWKKDGKQVTSRFREKPWRSAAYLAVVRGERCLACRSPFGVQAHHLRHSERRGVSRKTADLWAVPLCYECHMKCHTRGREGEWWAENVGVDPIEWAKDFYSRWKEGK